jgi:acid phosphatase (class A)
MKASRRNLLSIALVFVAVAGGGYWWSQHTTFRYLSGETETFVSQFGSPPAAESAETRQELGELLELQHARTPSQVAAAQADRRKDVSHFFVALGLDPEHRPALPALQSFTDTAEADIGPYVRAAKEKFRRLRPYAIEPKLEPCIGDVADDQSYPSGHATYGYVMGSLLSELVPERRTELMRRAEEFARQRMVCGVHFPSDLEAGRRGADFLVGEMHRSAAFQHDADAARTELRAALKLP